MVAIHPSPAPRWAPATDPPLFDADHQPEPVVTGQAREAFRRRSRHHDGVFGQQPEPVVVTVPDRLGIDPDRSTRDKHLGEYHQLSPLRGGLRG